METLTKLVFKIHLTVYKRVVLLKYNFVKVYQNPYLNKSGAISRKLRRQLRNSCAVPGET